MQGPAPALTLRPAFLAALSALALVAAPAAAQEGISGTWMFSIDSPDVAGTIEVPFTFEQSGTAVTGTVDLSALPQVEAAEISEGVFEDGVLFFVLHVGAQGQWIAVEIEADVDGDEMVGEAYMAEMGQYAAFTAKRSATD